MEIIYLSAGAWQRVGPGMKLQHQERLEYLELLLRAGGDFDPANAFAVVFPSLLSRDIPLKIGMIKLLLTYGTNIFEPLSYQLDNFLFFANLIPI